MGIGFLLRNNSNGDAKTVFSLVLKVRGVLLCKNVILCRFVYQPLTFSGERALTRARNALI